MCAKFAKRMENIRSSAIRELLKLTERPEIISFAGGLPAPELFPVESFRTVCNEVLEREGRQALQYSTTEGYLPLREKIVQRMAKVGIRATADMVLVTNGSQQGLDFVGKVFIDPQDFVVCENPSYLGAINAFRAYMPQFLPVPMDENGMRVELLEDMLVERKDASVKFIYVIPDFQNPTGRTLSLERRKKLVELANRYDLYIVEDNPYGELRFDGSLLPAVKSFDTEGRVIYLGTFSKTFCPGLRLGWIHAHPEVLQKFILVKQGADLQAATLAQREAAHFMTCYNLDEHIEKIIAVYKKRRDLMLKMLESEFPPQVAYTRPQGGLFLWVTLPEGIDAAKVLEVALEEKVAFVPGGSFFPCGGGDNHFRLNYSNMTEERIEEGMQRLARVVKKILK